MTGTVEVTDGMVWAGHIHGDERLVDLINKLAPGAKIRLAVDTKTGEWIKIKRDPAKQATGHAVRPIDRAARSTWRRLYPSRKGDRVSIRLVEG